MSTQMQRAKDLLYGPDGIGATNVKFTPGTNRDATPEQIAEQLANAVEALEAGDVETVWPEPAGG